MAVGTVYPEQDRLDRNEPANAIVPPGSPSLSVIAATAASLTTDSYSILASADLTSALSLAEHVAHLTATPHLYVHRSSVEKVAVCVRQLLPTLHLLKNSTASLSFDPRSAFVLRRLASELKDVIALLKACKLTIPGMFFSLGHHHKGLARKADACVTEIRHCHTVCSMLLGQASSTTNAKIAADHGPLSTSLVSQAPPPMPQNYFPLRTVSCSHTSGSSKEPSTFLESYSGSGITGGSGTSMMFPGGGGAEQPARVLQQVAEMFPQSPMIGPSAATFSAKDSARPPGMMTWQQMQVRGIPPRSISASAASGFGAPPAGGLYGRGGSAGRQRPGVLTGAPPLALLGGERRERDSSAADAAASAALALIAANGSGAGGGGGGGGGGSRFACPGRTYTVSSASSGRIQPYYGSIAVSPRPLSPATAAAAAAAAAFAAPRMFSPRRPRASSPLPSALNRSSISAAAAASANVCRLVDALAEGSAEEKRAALASLMDVTVTDEGKLQAAAAGVVPVLSVLLSLPEDDFLLDDESVLPSCVDDDDWLQGGGVLSAGGSGGGSGGGSAGSRGTGNTSGSGGGGERGKPGGISCGRGAVAALLPLPPLPEPPPRESLNLLVARALVQLSALPANCQVIAKAGCVPSLIAMLRGGNPEAQAVAVNLLLNLATGCDSDRDSKSPAIVAGEAIPSLVAIVQSAGEAKVRRQAMEALAHVVAKAKENQDAAARAGAIPILTEALREGSLLVQEKAAFALGSIAEDNDENKVMIAGTGAVPPLLDLLLCGPADISLQERVSRRAAWALFALSSHRLSASYIVASGGLDVVKRADEDGPLDTKEWTAKIIPLLDPVAEQHQQEQQQAAWQQKWTNQRRGRVETVLRKSYDDVASFQEGQRLNGQKPSRLSEQGCRRAEESEETGKEEEEEDGQMRKQLQEDGQMRKQLQEDGQMRKQLQEDGQVEEKEDKKVESNDKVDWEERCTRDEEAATDKVTRSHDFGKKSKGERQASEKEQTEKEQTQLQKHKQEGHQEQKQPHHRKQQQQHQHQQQLQKRPMWQFSVHPSSSPGGSLRQLCKQKPQSPQPQQQQQQSKAASTVRSCRAHKQ